MVAAHCATLFANERNGCTHSCHFGRCWVIVIGVWIAFLVQRHRHITKGDGTRRKGIERSVVRRPGFGGFGTARANLFSDYRSWFPAEDVLCFGRVGERSRFGFRQPNGRLIRCPKQPYIACPFTTPHSHTHRERCDGLRNSLEVQRKKPVCHDVRWIRVPDRTIDRWPSKLKIHLTLVASFRFRWYTAWTHGRMRAHARVITRGDVLYAARVCVCVREWPIKIFGVPWGD